MRVPLQEAVHLLNAGKIVAVPTETVYGLAAFLNHPEAVSKIFQKKNRPANNPLIIHIANIEQLNELAVITNEAHEIAEKFWPGPLTIVLEAKTEKIPSNVRAGLSTAAFRIPQHPLTLHLLELTGPLVMPSANLSGKPSATSPEHVENDFGKDFPVLDGGACKHGVESTIVIQQNDKWKIIRVGAIPAEAFKIVLNYIPEIVATKNNEAPICPGQSYRHYSPKAHLLLTDKPEQYQGIVVGFKDRKYPSAKRVLYFGYSSKVDEVAEQLYAVLRHLDTEGIEEACVDINVPQNGLWTTILERLHKAQKK